MLFTIFVIITCILSIISLAYLIGWFSGEVRNDDLGASVLLTLIAWVVMGIWSDNSAEEPEPLLITKAEETYISRQPYQNSRFDLLIEQVKAQRTAPYINPHPFCDSVDYVRAYSKKLADTVELDGTNHVYLHELLDLYYTANPKALAECTGSVVVPRIQEPDVKVVLTPKVEQPTVPVELIEKLTEVAEECNTAKVLLTVHDNLESLDIKMANAVIKDCKMDKLREELNK